MNYLVINNAINGLHKASFQFEKEDVKNFSVCVGCKYQKKVRHSRD